MATNPENQTGGAASTDDPEWEIWEATEQTGKIPAVFANRLFVQPDGLHLRLTFGEQVGDEVVYRSSFMVPVGVALEMGQLVSRMAGVGIESQVQQWRDWIANNPEKGATNG